MIPVLRALHALFTRVYYWARPLILTETSTDIEKAISFTENQRRGTTHSHDIAANYDPAPILCDNSGTCYSHINLQPVRPLYILRCASTDHILKERLRYFCHE